MIWTSVFAACAAFALTWLAGKWFIPFLHKLKYGQTILDIGPRWHKEKKQGTPTMGGIMFIIAAFVSFICGMILFHALGGVDLSNPVNMQELIRSSAGLMLAVMMGFMGFLDDFIKVKKKQNGGLTVMQKTVIQVLIIAAYFATLYLSGDKGTSIMLPWGYNWDLGLLYYPIMGVAIYYIVNAVNLTDGIDGLCSSVTVVYMAAFAAISGIVGAYGHTLLSMCVAGGCIGFLMWNFPPAKVFMGDTGSMFLGGAVCAMGIGCNAEVLMIIAAIVYILEALSVVIQVSVFKITKKIYHTTEGKRLFKMTPIHHHFELSNWSEVKIDLVFSLVALVAGAVSVLLAFYLFGK
ncbi:MAG: phospho-N-acetylmuramoyl-pentapeptide-transferase [Oscillospiraceae bacterium]|nr:phospho-N-acetylmuramoyl-pentapeptide-transferase [Oscillospiraceae bacterium]